jgi:hypothetical protein
MKGTLAMFLAAFALLAFAVAVPQRAVPALVENSLDDIDFDGIDSVRVEGTGEMTIRFAETGALSWPSDGTGDVTTRRDGSTLVLTSTLESYRSVLLSVPVSVHEVGLPGGRVEAEVPVDTLTIRVDDQLVWDGDVRHLHVVDSRNRMVDDRAEAGEDAPVSLQPCLAREDAFCQNLVIGEGEIGELEVDAQDGNVVLSAPSRIGRATLRLRPYASYSLGATRSAESIDVILLDAAGQEQPTNPPVGFADEADAPPVGDEANAKND